MCAFRVNRSGTAGGMGLDGPSRRLLSVIIAVMQKGDVVLIKASRGEPGVRRVWDPAPDRPWVCLEEYWERWQNNQVEPVCWQVARGQVFQYDTALAGELEAAFAARAKDAGRLEQLWARAKPAS